MSFPCLCPAYCSFPTTSIAPLPSIQPHYHSIFFTPPHPRYLIFLNLVDFTAKSVKDLLQYANTRDPLVQVKAINELISRWKPDITSPRGNARGESNTNEALVAQIKAERGLRILMNLATDNKDSSLADVVTCQARLTKLLALLTESSTNLPHPLPYLPSIRAFPSL